MTDPKPHNPRPELDNMDDDTFDPQEDDGSLDIEDGDNWLGGLGKVAKPKEIPRDTLDNWDAGEFGGTGKY